MKNANEKTDTAKLKVKERKDSKTQAEMEVTEKNNSVTQVELEVMICGKCNGAIDDEEGASGKSLECDGPCKEHYHPDCVGLKEEEYVIITKQRAI